MDGVFLSTNNGSSWIVVNTGLTNTYVRALTTCGPNIFAGTQSGVFRSTDNGTSWTAASKGLTNGDVNSLAVSGTNLFAGGSGVFLSTDSGIDWTANGLTNFSVLCFAVSGLNLFAGTYPGGVFLSTNNGTSWAAVNTGVTNTYVVALAVSGTNLFAAIASIWGSGGGVFLSTDNGTSWTVTGLINHNVYSFAVRGPNIFAGTTDAGVFLSTNNGTSWTAVNTGLTTTLVYALVVSDTNLFAGTNCGAWRRPLSDMLTEVKSGELLPRLFALEQNYPNPFNPSTTIRYSLPHRSQVLLTVYNTLGQQVATLVQGEQEAGSYEVKFDGSGLASGVYFYRIQAGSYVETRKLVLIR
jgi:hypothetical protein